MKEIDRAGVAIGDRRLGCAREKQGKERRKGSREGGEAHKSRNQARALLLQNWVSRFLPGRRAMLKVKVAENC
jgi:hypothetical protein